MMRKLFFVFAVAMLFSNVALAQNWIEISLFGSNALFIEISWLLRVMVTAA